MHHFLNPPFRALLRNEKNMICVTAKPTPKLTQKIQFLYGRCFFFCFPSFFGIFLPA
jgi:hypothetical protein